MEKLGVLQQSQFHLVLLAWHINLISELHILKIADGQCARANHFAQFDASFKSKSNYRRLCNAVSIQFCKWQIKAMYFRRGLPEASSLAG